METEKRSKARVRHGASQLGEVSLRSELREFPAVELLALKPGKPQEAVHPP